MSTTAFLPSRTIRDDERRREAPARPRFTPRELQVVRLLAVSYSFDEIATIRGIGRRTVKAHAESLARKCGVRHRREIPRTFMALTGTNPYPGGDDA